MKTLSIHAPWAWAIVNGYKLVENRPRRFNYRGRIAIHASLSRESDEVAAEVFAKAGIKLPSPEELDAIRGKIIGTVELVDCVEYATGDGREALAEQLHGNPWASGPFCLMLARPAKVRPVPAKGALSLWNSTAELVAV